MSITYFPRLSESASLQVVGYMNNTEDLEELSAQASPTHPFATYYSLAKERVSEDSLAQLRSDLLSLATELGFPDESTRDARREFDQRAAPMLDGKNMNLIPAEAADREVWNFLTLILLPDLAKWRYPNPNKDPRYNRWLGDARNVFRKLWWRQVVLGTELNSVLGEDEAVSIMERTTLAGQAPLARAMARAAITVAQEYPDLPRSQFARFSAVLVRAQNPLYDFSGLSETELNHQVLKTYRFGASRFRTRNSLGGKN